MKFSGIKETVIYVSDLKETKRFYQSVLKLKLYSQKEEEFVFFKVGEDMLLFFNPQQSREKTNLPAHFAEGDQHFAITTGKSDYAEWKKRIDQEVGIEHIQDWGNGIESFYFRDPENNSVEIVMENMWP